MLKLLISVVQAAAAKGEWVQFCAPHVSMHPVQPCFTAENSTLRHVFYPVGGRDARQLWVRGCA